MRTSTRSLLAALLAALAAGCNDEKGKSTDSGSSAKPPPAPPPTMGAPVPGTPPPAPLPSDACSLITAQEAAAILGELREPPKPATSIWKGACSYWVTGGANVTVEMGDAAQWEFQKSLDTGDKKPLSGLGEEAFYSLKSGNVDLWARKGGAMLRLTGSIGLDKTKAMAAKALERL
jgi:hypothetical protein